MPSYTPAYFIISRNRLGWLRLAILAGLGVITTHAYAQDPHFSQYYASPLYLNPALAGKDRDIAFSCIYRSQWASTGFPQNTGQISVLVPLVHANPRRLPLGGFGFSAFNDRAGENLHFRSTGANAAFAYNFPAYDASRLITLAGQVGFVQKSLDAGQLRWGSQYDPFLGFTGDKNPPAPGLITERTTYPVLNAGLMWYHNPRKTYKYTNLSAFAGLAVSNLNRPDESLIANSRSPLPLLYKLHGGAEWNVSGRFNLSPAILVMHQYGNYQLNLGSYLTYKGLTNPQNGPVYLVLGSWYRFGDAFIITTGIHGKQYAAAISYDLTASSLRYQNRSRGALELSLTYRILRDSGVKNFSTPLM
jgi:type IX secretion system PorP/SprF family membrane protein